MARLVLTSTLLAATLLGLAAGLAHAADAPPGPPRAAPPPAPCPAPLPAPRPAPLPATPPAAAPAAPAAPPPSPTRDVPDPAPFLDVTGASLAGVSRDGATVFFRMASAGVTQLFRTGRDGGWPHRLTFRGEGVDFVVASPDGTQVVLGYDHDGDEDHGLFLRATADGGAERVLADRPGVKHGGVVWSDDGTRVFFHANALAPDDFALFTMALADAAPTPVLTAPGRWAVEDVGREARRLLVSREVSARARSLHVLTLDTGALIEVDPAPAGREVLPGDANFANDDAEVVFLSDRDGAWRRAYAVRLADGVVRALDAPPGDIEQLTVSPDGTTVVLTVNDGGRSVLVARDVATGAARPAPDVGAALVGGVWIDARRSLFLGRSDASTPGTVMRWDPPADGAGPGTFTPLTFPDFAGLARADLDVTPTEVRYPTFDGREVPAWLYLPTGRAPQGLPFVVSFHGGPAAQERPGFHAERAYLLSLGFGVLAPNVRGSTGYGRAYRDLDDGAQRLDAVKDGKAAVDWLVARGYADPARIAATGGSYGGFMVLALLTEYPDAFAAGVDVVGIANFETFLANTAGYRRAHRASEYGSLDDRALLRSISPIHKVDRIRAPLLIGHGEHDPRVPVSEARQIEAALKARGSPVEAVYFADEGHGFAKKDNRRAWTRRLAAFLVRTLRPT